MPRKKTTKRKASFATWRVLAQSGSRRLSVDSTKKACEFVSAGYDDWVAGMDKVPEFDELVIAGVAHLERMDSKTLWANIGPVDLAIWVDAKGVTRVRMTEGAYDPKTGDFHPHGWKPKTRRAK